jgi:hypothetical protein
LLLRKSATKAKLKLLTNNVSSTGTLPVHDFKLWMETMYDTYGPISKITNIPGRRDMVFLFEPSDFEVVYRNEGVWPERLAFDSFPYYRNVVRKDFFGDVGGILSV